MTMTDQLIARLRAKVEGYQRDGDILRGSRLARALTREFPDCGLTEAQVVNLILLEAARAGLAMEVGGD